MMKKLLCTLLFSVIAIGFVNAQADVNLQGNGNDIADDAGATPLESNHTDFLDVAIGSSFTRTFTIQNTGTGDLNLTGAGIAFQFGSDSQFSLDLGSTGTPITNVTPTTFDVIFTATTLGVANAVVIVTTDDPDVAEQSYEFAITANVTAAAPDVNLQGNGNDIVDDAGATPLESNHTDFLDVAIGSSFTRTFTIQNTGGGDLNLTGAGVSFQFGSDSQFSLDLSGTGTPITNVTPTTFDVIFTATTLGVANAVVIVTTDDPDVAEQSYEFAITANVTAAAPDVNLQGNGNDIVDDAGATPLESNHTDFLDVAIGSSFTRTFTIQNTGGGDLNLTGSGIAFQFGSDSQFSLDLSSTGTPITNVTPTTFDVIFTATTLGVANAVVIVTTDDPDVAEQSYEFAITANVTATAPDVNLQGNGNDIADDAGATPLESNHTDFLDVAIGSSFTRTFTIQNTGVGDLNLTGSGVSFQFGSDSQFSLDLSSTGTPITNVTPTTFDVIFTATTLGVANAVVIVTTDDPDVAEQSYEFAITANTITDPNADAPLLITQYYEGGGNNQYIEVKNISLNTVPQQYYLALYTGLNTQANIISSSPPNASIQIPTMTAGQVLLFKNPNATVPTTSGTPTTVCTFSGDDVVLISGTNDAGCYAVRIDIMGVVPSAGSSPPIWGAGTSFIKGCGTNELPTGLNGNFDATVNSPTDVDVNDYIELTNEQVNTANPATNLALGIQTVGSTIYATSWSNGIPDITKNATISGTYNAAAGSFEACNLTVNGSIILDGNTTNYVKVNEDLTINGGFTIGDTESLITVNETASITGSITKLESSTTLNNFRDFTYWSSPVQGASTAVFTNTGVDPSRIFEWDKPSLDDFGSWQVKSGGLEQARGYISEAPSGSTQHDISFSGSPYNGNINIFLGFDPNNTGGGGGFNLIGNPYPSAIDIEEFIKLDDNDAINNNTMDGTIWLWTHNTPMADNDGSDNDFTVDDYATYNLSGGVGSGSPATSGGAAPTQNIGSSQGFFVKAVSAGNVFFTNAMRLDNENDQFFKSNSKKVDVEKDRVWLNMSSDQGAFNQILVGFFNEATDLVDRGYDGLKFNGGNYISFYSKIDDAKYAIQGLGSFNADKQISLGFDTSITQTFKISISNIEGVLKTEDLYLVDNVLNIVHDLKQGDYEFDITETGSYSDRFTLQFNSNVLGVDEELTIDSFIIVNEEDRFHISANQEIAKLKVYDIMGRLLINQKPNASDFFINTYNIKKGTVLIINATAENGSVISKKAIKY